MRDREQRGHLGLASPHNIRLQFNMHRDLVKTLAILSSVLFVVRQHLLQSPGAGPDGSPTENSRQEVFPSPTISPQPLDTRWAAAAASRVPRGTPAPTFRPRAPRRDPTRPDRRTDAVINHGEGGARADSACARATSGKTTNFCLHLYSISPTRLSTPTRGIRHMSRHHCAPGKKPRVPNRLVEFPGYQLTAVTERTVVGLVG